MWKTGSSLRVRAAVPVARKFSRFRSRPETVALQETTVTVCIAAIANWNGPLVIGATDSMLTAGDIEFEPPKSKMYLFNESGICALIAGESTAQIAICDKVRDEIAACPSAFTTCESVAHEYGKQLTSYRLKEMESQILRPAGLDFATFASQQHDLVHEFVLRKWREIESFQLDCSTLIIGCDQRGPHIFMVDENGSVRCFDAVGFVATGSGGRHAESEFMFSGYVPGLPLGKALLVTYSAKKRAEVAPGVGLTTFMGIATANPARFWIYAESDPLIKVVASVYNETQKKLGRMQKLADARVEERLAELLNRPVQGSVAPQMTSPAHTQSDDVPFQQTS
jgi:hypothetical protein